MNGFRTEPTLRLKGLRRRFCGVLWELSALLLLFACRVGAGFEDAGLVAIQRHQDMLHRIRAYHVVLELNEAEGEVPGNPLVRSRLFEEWRAGFRRHVLKRTYVRNSARVTDTRVRNPQGQVVEYLVDARETRVMEGWDREHPFPLPLDFIRAPVEFGTVYC